MSDTVPKVALDAAYSYLKKAPDLWVKHICAFKVFSETGAAQVDCSKGAVCHGSVHIDKNTALVISAQCKKHRDTWAGGGHGSEEGSPEEANQAFMTYLARENPLGELIINRDDLSSIFEGGIIIDAQKAGIDRTIWLCKAFRYCNEDRYRPKIWYDLVQNGVHPFVAFVMCSTLSQNGDASGSTHNTVISRPASMKQLANALAMKSYKDTRGKMIGGCYSSNTFNVFGFGGDYHSSSKEGPLAGISLKQRQVKVDDGWGGYVMKTVPADLKETAKQLIEITQQAMELNKDGNDNKVVRIAAKGRGKVDVAPEIRHKARARA